MKDEIFGEVFFDTGWNKYEKLCLWGISYEILVTAAAYYEHEPITEKQRLAYQDFINNRTIIEKKIEQLLAGYIDDPQNNLQPRFLVFEEKGEYALMLDNKLDPDDGIAVQITPKEKVMSQDAYL